MDSQATSYVFLPQADSAAVFAPEVPPARVLSPSHRQNLAIKVLGRTHPVAELARRHQVSRKFLYRQAGIAQHALTQAFQPKPADSRVLFYLPVTKAWLCQLVLALVLVGHSSFRGVVILLRDLFDWPISLGAVHLIVSRAVEPARAINRSYHLGDVRIGAHDEIFQADDPVFVGIDTTSGYNYLLSLEEHCDAETWGVRLLELADQGFAPDAIVADAGLSLRAGQALALPEIPCRGDHFHILRDLESVVSFLENRAYDAIKLAENRYRDFELARRRDGHSKAKSYRSAAMLWRPARDDAAAAVTLADDVALLVRWLRYDILAVAGPCHADRLALYDFVVEELKRRIEQCPHRLRPICRQLNKQRDELLAFALVLDGELAAVAEEFLIPVQLPRRLLGTLARDVRDVRRWREESALRRQLRGRFYEVQVAVAAVASATVRASSLAENLNSRLRSYFFLRRHLGGDYLALLQFYLNHRVLERSDRPERVGKTPAELLTGEPHPHWLELLGYTRFRRT